MAKRDLLKENSPQEKEAFKAILSDPNPKLEEREFLEHYWPIIANIDGAGKYIGNWLTNVDRTMCQEVDILRNGELLYVLPPLLFTYPTEHTYDSSRSLSTISSNADGTRSVSPIAAERYLTETLAKHLESVLESDVGVRTRNAYMRRWDEIWVRYGLPPRFGKYLGDDAVVVETETKPEVEQPAFEDYDEL